MWFSVVYGLIDNDRFDFYHNIKETKSLSIENIDSGLKVHAPRYANELLVRVRLKKMLGKRVMTRTRYR